MEIVATESVGFVDNVKNMTFDERLMKLKQLGNMLGETLKRGEEKVALAKSTYDTVGTRFSRVIRISQLIAIRTLRGCPSNVRRTL